MVSKKTEKWIVLLLLVLTAFYCGSGEKKQLLKQLDQLIIEENEYRDINELMTRLEKARSLLSRYVMLISDLKNYQDIGIMIETALDTVPNSVLLKEFFFSNKTLNFTLLFPSTDSVSTFVVGLENTPCFERIESFPGERQTAKLSSRYTEYTVVCDYIRKEDALPPTWKSLLPYIRKPRENVDEYKSKLRGLNTEELKQEIQNIQRSTTVLKKKKKKEVEIREELKGKQGVITKLKIMLPEKVDEMQVIKEIQDIASKSKIKITECSDLEARKRGIFFDISFSIQLTGRCRNIVDFIRTLEIQKRIFVVNSVYMIFPNGKIHQDQVNMSLNISTYSRNPENR